MVVCLRDVWRRQGRPVKSFKFRPASRRPHGGAIEISAAGVKTCSTASRHRKNAQRIQAARKGKVVWRGFENRF